MSTDIKQIRQGDVLLIRTTEPAEREIVIGPDGLPINGIRVEGERTGHAHELRGEVFDLPSGTRAIAIRTPTSLTHQEHAHIVVPEGWWEVRVQREWAPRSSGYRQFSRSTRRFD
jgi:hypothetical protein